MKGRSLHIDNKELLNTPDYLLLNRFPGRNRAELRSLKRIARDRILGKKLSEEDYMRQTKNAQIERLQLQLSHYRSLHDRKEKDISRTELIIHEMKKVLSVLSPQRPFNLPKSNGENSPEDMVVLVSDAQAGTEVVGAELGNFPDYNMDVFRYRLRLYFRSIASIIERKRKEFRVPRIHVWLGGDLLENESIFQPQMSFIDTNVMNQFYIVQYEVARFLSSLARFNVPILVYCNPGNHGRVGSYKEHNDWVNWEYMLYRDLQWVMKKHSNVEFVIPNEWYIIRKIAGQTFMFVHGEDVNKWLNFPWYGLDRYYKNYSEMMEKIGQPFQHMVTGHEHIPVFWRSQKGFHIVNGSFVGATRFTAKRLQSAVDPGQWVFFVHPRQGISSQYLIDLTKKDEELWRATLADGYDKKVPVTHEKLVSVEGF